MRSFTRNTRNKSLRVIPATRSGAAPPLQGPEEVLGISPRATKEEILAAFRAKSKAHHPDKGGDAEVMKQLLAARDAMLAALDGAVHGAESADAGGPGALGGGAGDGLPRCEDTQKVGCGREWFGFEDDLHDIIDECWFSKEHFSSCLATCCGRYVTPRGMKDVCKPCWH